MPLPAPVPKGLGCVPLKPPWKPGAPTDSPAPAGNGLVTPINDLPALTFPIPCKAPAVAPDINAAFAASPNFLPANKLPAREPRPAVAKAPPTVPLAKRPPAKVAPLPKTVGANPCKAYGAAIANAIGAIVLNAFDFVILRIGFVTLLAILLNPFKKASGIPVSGLIVIVSIEAKPCNSSGLTCNINLSPPLP